VNGKTKLKSALAVALAALVLALVLAGCGSTSSPSASPSTIYPQSSATGTLPALKAYLSDARSVLDQVGTTVAALPDAVQGLSKTPDATWTSSASQLQSIATQLSDEASALAAMDPPTALQPVQSAVVKGIQTAQSGVDKLASKLASKAQSTATRKAKVQSRVSELKAQIEGVTQQLQNALSGLTGQ
jgi:hypothetical protein